MGNNSLGVWIEFEKLVADNDFEGYQRWINERKGTEIAKRAEKFIKYLNDACSYKNLLIKQTTIYFSEQLKVEYISIPKTSGISTCVLSPMISGAFVFKPDSPLLKFNPEEVRDGFGIYGKCVQKTEYVYWVNKKESVFPEKQNKKEMKIKIKFPEIINVKDEAHFLN